jgi:hypothetical protein
MDREMVLSGIFRYILILSVFFTPSFILADSEEIQSFSFGSIAITGNDVVSELVISHVNGISPVSTNKIHILSFGQPGKYRIFGFPAHTYLSTTVNGSQLTIGAAEPLEMSDFTYNNLVTDATGQAILTVGGTLSTTGLGTNYNDATYAGSITIVIAY